MFTWCWLFLQILYIEIEVLTNGFLTSEVKTKLKSIFSRHGIPQVLITDNGSTYNSKEFQSFCSEWNTSSPYLASSNGIAEGSV